MVVLPEQPKLPDRFTLIPTGSGEFRLHSFFDSFALNSTSPNLLARLLPLLDGEHHVDDILQELHAFGEERVVEVLAQLYTVGMLEDKSPSGSDILSQDEYQRYRDQIVFFSHFAAPHLPGIPTSWPNLPRSGVEYQEKLKQATVALFGLGRLGSQLVRLLAQAGVGRLLGVDKGVVDTDDACFDAWYGAEHVGMARAEVLRDQMLACNPWVEFTPRSQPIESAQEIAPILAECDFAVLCTDDFHPAQYEIFNQVSLQEKRPWTSCRLLGFEFNIGPTVVPHETPCYKCFDLRQKGNLTDYEEYLLLEGYFKSNAHHSGRLIVTPGIGLVALEVCKALTHFVEPATYAHLYSINLLTLETRRHPILKVPRCPHCGRPGQGQPTIQIWQTNSQES